MAKEKKTVGTNYLNLPWPQDPNGVAKSLRDGGVKAVGRVKGNAENQKRFEETVAVLVAYSREKFAFEVAQREGAKVNAANAARRSAEKAAAVASEKVAVLQKALDESQAVVAAKAAELEAVVLNEAYAEALVEDKARSKA